MALGLRQAGTLRVPPPQRRFQVPGVGGGNAAGAFGGGGRGVRVLGLGLGFP